MMTTTLLLPNTFKKIGWIILVPATILGIILAANGFESNWANTKVFSVLHDSEHLFDIKSVNVTNTVIGCLFILGAMFVGFAREKREDEFIASLRLNALLWAVFVNYVLLLAAFLFVYDFAFLNVMLYNMFTVLILFIVRFNYLLFKHSTPATDEK
jgi:small-conductance mechanosensitive channel